MGNEEMKTVSVDKVLSLKSGVSWGYAGRSGMQEMHRQIQNRFGTTSELAVGKLLLMSASVSARPPGRAGDTAGPRAHFSVAESDRMRLDRFQAWDPAGKRAASAYLIPRPLPSPSPPIPHPPRPTAPLFASPILAPYSSRRGRR